MFRKPICLLAHLGILVLFNVDVAEGGALSIAGPPNVVSWVGGPSPTVTSRIENNSGALDAVFTYQVLLQISPAAGAAGQLKFATATVADDNYIFDPSSAISNVQPTAVTFTDFRFPPVGVPLSGFNLIDLTVDKTDGPSGLFDITLVPFPDNPPLGLDDSSHYFAAGDLGPTHFANAPAGAGSVVVASILVGTSVPEPSSFILFLTALCLLPVFGLSRRRERRHRRHAGQHANNLTDMLTR